MQLHKFFSSMTQFAQPSAIACLLASNILLSGCAGLAVKGVSSASDRVTIAVNEDTAKRGDPVAQYKLGLANCCAIGAVDPLHDNVKATLWLCRAARQNHAPAQYLLGRIYSGHPIVGIDPQQQVKLLLAGAPVDRAVARVWFARAASSGHRDATSELSDLLPKLSKSEVAKSDQFLQDWKNAPCDYSDVFSNKSVK
jgi:TPR repeat protein